MLEQVVIIGRANVGKSTLFNRLAEKRAALVSAEPGTTRDLKYATVNWQDKNFELIDSGGFLAEKKMAIKKFTRYQEKKFKLAAIDDLGKQVEKKAREALAKGKIILFVVDGQTGLSPQDKEIANLLRQEKNKKIILTVNKCDNERIRQMAADFYKLGLGEPFLVSATNGGGIGDLLDEIKQELSLAWPAEEINSAPPIKICILGKPNVGKSSLLNKMIGEEKAIVSATPHTTREPNDALIVFGGHKILLIDTAGLRRKAKIEANSLERLGVKMTLATLKKADTAILVLDISAPLSHQDLQLGQLITESNVGVIIVANKYDLLKNSSEQPAKQEKKEELTNVNFAAEFTNFIYRKFPHLNFAPIIFASAKSGFNISKIFNIVLDIEKAKNIQVSDNALSKFLKQLIIRQPPPRRKLGRGSKFQIKRAYITNFRQIKTRPPLFECEIGSEEKLPESYVQYIINNIREKFAFRGVPIKLVVRNKKI